jgi:hypothetical protein
MRNTDIDYNGWRIFDYAYKLLFCKEILCIDIQVFTRSIYLLKNVKNTFKNIKKNPKYIFLKLVGQNFSGLNRQDKFSKDAIDQN